jgi:hypothetical protein
MATTFRVQVSGIDDPGFASPSYDQSGLTVVPVGTTYTHVDFVNVPSLPNPDPTPSGKFIYTRVNVTTDAGTSDWSNSVSMQWQQTN